MASNSTKQESTQSIGGGGKRKLQQFKFIAINSALAVESLLEIKKSNRARLHRHEAEFAEKISCTKILRESFLELFTQSITYCSTLCFISVTSRTHTRPRVKRAEC